MELDYETELRATGRTLSKGQLAAPELNHGNAAEDFRTISLSRVMPCAIDALWDACTDPSQIAKWFSPVSGNLELGGRYQIEGNAGGTIVSCNKPNIFALTWEFGNDKSYLSVSLDSTATNSTTLRLDHAFAVNDHWRKFGPGAGGVGWDMGVLGLAAHLAGQPLPKDETWWQDSKEALAFLKGSSEAWGMAAVAAGEDAAWAEEAAKNTTAFYAPSLT